MCAEKKRLETIVFFIRNTPPPDEKKTGMHKRTRKSQTKSRAFDVIFGRISGSKKSGEIRGVPKLLYNRSVRFHLLLLSVFYHTLTVFQSEPLLLCASRSGIKKFVTRI